MTGKNRVPSPHQAIVAHTDRSVRVLMQQVILGMLPGIGLTWVFFGIGVLVQIALAATCVLLVELIVGRMRGDSPTSGLGDGSWLVLAFIVGVSVPPYCPWTITVWAALVGSLIGKHLYGGTGQNLFNPAMVGIVFVLVCFPNISTYWPSYADARSMSIVEGLALIFTDQGDVIDAISGATLLEFERTQLSLAAMRSEFTGADIYGVFAGRAWEWVNVGYLFGGIYLCVRRVIRITIPLWFLSSLFVFASIAYGYDSEQFAGPLIHWFAGATMLCAFFIATDPVSSPTGQRATAVYAVLLAALVFLFRVNGAYPDGVAFAVVLLNVLVPILDRLLSPQIYGHKSP